MCVEMKLKVEDVAKWQNNFQSNVGLRKEYGSKGAIAFTDPETPNEVTIVIKAMNKANIAKSRESGAFQNAMKESGIVGEPEMKFLSYVTELDS